MLQLGIFRNPFGQCRCVCDAIKARIGHSRLRLKITLQSAAEFETRAYFLNARKTTLTLAWASRLLSGITPSYHFFATFWRAAN
jgi:hypothetical protein